MLKLTPSALGVAPSGDAAPLPAPVGATGNVGALPGSSVTARFGAPLRRRGESTGHGFASQISVAYWAMVRSLEKKPDAAMLAMAFFVQASWSAYSSRRRRSASR